MFPVLSLVFLKLFLPFISFSSFATPGKIPMITVIMSLVVMLSLFPYRRSSSSIELDFTPNKMAQHEEWPSNRLLGFAGVKRCQRSDSKGL